MSNNQIELIGWQSWSDCRDPNNFIRRIRNYSPYYNANLLVSIKNAQQELTPIKGWCTWNNFMTKINKEVILEQVLCLKSHKSKISIEYILIDDGWTKWGDWSISDIIKFPNGIKDISDEISRMGFKTGLWIAPYLVDPDSLVVKNHPEWLVKNKKGNPINGKKNYFFDRLIPDKKYLLDLENKEAYSYILNCFNLIIKKWNIKLLKIDFLYAGHFNPIYQDSIFPDILLKKLLSDVKSIDKSIKIIACGCPLYPAVGVVDAMRISDDIILPPLKYIWPINKLMHTRRFNQLKYNYKLRKQTKKLWLIDPDMFVCHPKFGLNDSQIISFQNILLEANGVIMLGDNLLELNENQLQRYIYPLFA
jgi:alpha-galactosidase